MKTTRTRKSKTVAAHTPDTQVDGYDTREIIAKTSATPRDGDTPPDGTAGGYDTRVELPAKRTRVKVGSAYSGRARVLRPGMIPFSAATRAARCGLPFHDGEW